MVSDCKQCANYTPHIDKVVYMCKLGFVNLNIIPCAPSLDINVFASCDIKYIYARFTGLSNSNPLRYSTTQRYPNSKPLNHKPLTDTDITAGHIERCDYLLFSDAWRYHSQHIWVYYQFCTVTLLGILTSRTR